MNLILGSLVVFGSVIAGYLLSHGQLAALFQPYELLVIGGSAFGAFLISNPNKLVVEVLKGIPSLLAGSPYTKARYLDLLGLLHEILNKARKEGLIAIEADIENPDSSPVFGKYPSVLKDHHAVAFIADYLRLMISSSLRTFELDNLMTLELETHHEEALEPSHALTRVSDGLPGFGIVAAVLGVVITMGSLDGPVEQIGGHVAAALVGTFLGILLAYGFVGPMSTAMEHRAHEQGRYLGCIKAALLAGSQGYPPQIALEYARKAMPGHLRPSFQELEAHVKGSK